MLYHFVYTHMLFANLDCLLVRQF